MNLLKRINLKYFRIIFTIILLHLLNWGFVFSQDYINVTSTSVNSYDGVSYVYNGTVRLQPNFNYKATIDEGNFFVKRLSGFVLPSLYPLDYNSVKLETVKIEEVIEETQISSLNANEKRTDIRFFDGFNRVRQEKSLNASPNGNDIIQSTEFNSFNTKIKEYLPYALDQDNENYNYDYINETQTFYNGGSANRITLTEFPYTERVTEKNIINRVVKIGFPGESWNLGTDHTKELSYQENTTSDAVLHWILDSKELPVQVSSYSADKLYKNVTQDESGKKIIEFRNEFNLVVLKRIVLNESLSSWVDTYYVYDKFKRLRYVLPPEAVKQLFE